VAGGCATGRPRAQASPESCRLDAGGNERATVRHHRIGEVRADMNIRFGEELRDVMQAEFRAIRAEMEKNQSELLAKFANSIIV
jgi:hypothetical protein